MKQEAIPYKTIEIRNSILNVFDKPTIWSVVMPLQRLQDMNRESGYNAYEWHALNSTSVAGFQVNTNRMTDLERAAIGSLHESFMVEYGPAEMIKRKQLFFGMAATLLLRPGRDSLHTLSQVQKHAGRKLPAVVYPRFAHPYSIADLPFAETMMQPKPGDMYRFGRPGAGNYLAKFRELNLSVVLCTHHLRGDDELSGRPGFAPWRESFPFFLEHAREIHIAAGRIDRVYDGVDSLQELRDLVSGHGNSPIMDMLRMIKAANWKGPIVTEIPASALHMLQPKGLFLSRADYVEYHRRIVQTIGSIVA